MIYEWLIKHISFNSTPQPKPSGRKFIFKDKKDFDLWFKITTVGLATLDKPLNYCKYFERTNGNEGFYIREGKVYPVNGEWDEAHLNCPHKKDMGFVCCKMRGFRQFLEQNGWINNWFELKDSYKLLLEQECPKILSVSQG